MLPWHPHTGAFAEEVRDQFVSEREEYFAALEQVPTSVCWLVGSESSVLSTIQFMGLPAADHMMHACLGAAGRDAAGARLHAIAAHRRAHGTEHRPARGPGTPLARILPRVQPCRCSTSFPVSLCSLLPPTGKASRCERAESLNLLVHVLMHAHAGYTGAGAGGRSV